MQYEELQAIWETQRQRPVFALNEFSLHMELNRTRARTRRRHFWVDVFPLLVVAPVLIIPLLVPMLVFVFQGPLDQLPPGKLPMTGWDVVACLVGIALFGYAVWSMESNRRRNEQRQKVFAASLRQEIELGIAQVDFDMSCTSFGSLGAGLARAVCAGVRVEETYPSGGVSGKQFSGYFREKFPRASTDGSNGLRRTGHSNVNPAPDGRSAASRAPRRGRIRLRCRCRRRRPRRRPGRRRRTWSSSTPPRR